jgi:transposase-like protein
MSIDALPTPAVLPEPPVACPSCHTARLEATEGVTVARGDWRCERCGEQWTASRLATVAEYEAWDRARRDAAMRERS